MSATVRLTMAQALVRYLAAVRGDDETGRSGSLFAGVFAIFGHGNVAGIGEALIQHRAELPTYRATTNRRWRMRPSRMRRPAFGGG